MVTVNQKYINEHLFKKMESDNYPNKNEFSSIKIGQRHQALPPIPQKFTSGNSEEFFENFSLNSTGVKARIEKEAIRSLSLVEPPKNSDLLVRQNIQLTRKQNLDFDQLCRGLVEKRDSEMRKKSRAANLSDVIKIPHEGCNSKEHEEANDKSYINNNSDEIFEEFKLKRNTQRRNSAKSHETQRPKTGYGKSRTKPVL